MISVAPCTMISVAPTHILFEAARTTLQGNGSRGGSESCTAPLRKNTPKQTANRCGIIDNCNLLSLGIQLFIKNIDHLILERD